MQGDEACDDAELNGVSGMTDCMDDCTLTSCGDGFLGLPETEECDQGESNADDAACTEACAVAVCGDELVGPGESCDDGVKGSDTCTPGCVLATCGDGIIQAGEDCDDENDVSTDACLNCVAASCGDGFVEMGEEQCDDGAANASDPPVCAYGVTDENCTYCSASSCSVEQGITSFCGDGVLQAGDGEDCDDGDTIEGNGCNSNCTPSGQELWTHEVHVGADDVCRTVRIDGGEVYLAGRVGDPAVMAEVHRYWAQRLDADGQVEWTTVHGPHVDEEDYNVSSAGLEQDSFVLAGWHRENLLTTNTVSYLAAISRADGSVTWVREDLFGAKRATGIAFGALSDASGGFASAELQNVGHLVAVTETGTTGAGVFTPDRSVQAVAFSLGGDLLLGEDDSTSNAFLRRRNAGLGVLSDTPLTGLHNVTNVTTTGDGGIYVTGGFNLLSSAVSDGWLVRLDSTGTEIWRRETGDLGADAYGVAAAENGDAFVAGRQAGSPWIARIAQDSGETNWEHAAGGDGYFVSVASGEGPSGPFAVACGFADTGGANGDDILAIAVTE